MGSFLGVSQLEEAIILNCHYDDVFDLLGIYYSSGKNFETFSAAIDTWVSITER